QHIYINKSLNKENLLQVDLVVEAIAEDEKIKGNLFKNLSEITDDNTILASNTSSISIQKMADYTHCANRVIGMHFMNPVPIMKLVEIITTPATSNQTIQKIVDITVQLKKEPCIVKDYPGFIANRILMPMINEAILSVEAKIATVTTIDTICKLGFSHPMGPLQLADFIGLDICSNILQIMEKDFNNVKYHPSKLLLNMINKGYLGKKSGMGFYDYSQGFSTLIENKNILN
ncbi:MAG: 3-hydroxyacyl-CoA dehydrogenase NAD-binding domain-containing protein, partial [Sediminibacterium sp.]|nr:3-hydroxyacyl-CoA dehydrogenase NAD-binding domain-containing protein [Sediminibacterium sp.]